MGFNKVLILSLVLSAAIPSTQADEEEPNESTDVPEVEGSEQESLAEVEQMNAELQAGRCNERYVFPDDSENIPSEDGESIPSEDIESIPSDDSESVAARAFEETEETDNSTEEHHEPDHEFLEMHEKMSIWGGFQPDKDVRFFFYSRKTWSREELHANKKSFQKSKFNKNAPTKITIHGWQQKHTDLSLIKDAYLRLGDVNCIMIDWSLGADDPLYLSSRMSVGNVGKVIAKFVDFMFKEGFVKHKNLHVVGHSLGAHIAGFVGKYVKTFKVPVIVGLDPAEPLFDVDEPSARIDKKDGDYVAIIHTSIVGLSEPLGHADFYLNYGTIQPGCGFDFLNICSHGRSVEYFAESITSKNFKAIRCKSANLIINHNKCKQIQKPSIMTTEVKNKPHGVFLVLTRSQSPFAKP